MAVTRHDDDRQSGSRATVEEQKLCDSCRRPERRGEPPALEARRALLRNAQWRDGACGHHHLARHAAAIAARVMPGLGSPLDYQSSRPERLLFEANAVATVIRQPRASRYRRRWRSLIGPQAVTSRRLLS